MKLARPSRTWLRAVGLSRLVSAWLLLPTCVRLFDLPDDPVVAPSGPWRCLSQQRLALSPARAEPRELDARVTVFACDFIANCTEPVTELSGKLCDRRDVGCQRPREEGLTDEEGVFSLEVPTSGDGFDGYLQITAPLASCLDERAFPGTEGRLCALAAGCDPEAPDEACLVPTYAPALVFFDPPIVETPELPIVVPLLPSAALPAVVEAAGARLDPTTGNLFITAMDCDGNTASGVSYEIAQHQDVVTPLYVDSGVVSDTVFETDDSGIGGFVGVPPGFVEVMGFTAEGELIGELGLQAAPFALTYAFMAPPR